MSPGLHNADTLRAVVAGRSRVVGAGEMAELTRSLDWGETALGPLAGWPEALLSAVNMILASPLPMQLLWGPDFVVLYNDALRATIADKHPQALGRPGREVWAEAWSAVGHQLEGVLLRGESVSFREVPIPLLLHGELQETFWDYSYSPIYGSDGAVLGVLDIAQDITEAVLSRRQQEELRRREAVLAEELAQVLAVTSDAVVSVDRDWRLTYFNAKAEQLFGPSSKYAGQTFWEAFPEAGQEGSPFAAPLKAAMDQNVPGHVEAYYPEPLNLWLSVNVHPSRQGIVIFSRNVTEVRKTYEALLQNEKLAAVGRLASSIAHEINNPLESVTNLLYLIKGTQDIDDIQAYANTAEGELRRVALIANQTLRFHKQSTRPLPAFCYDLIGDSLAIYQNRVVNNRIQVEKRKRAEHPVQCLDAEIRQVLNNLIGNAIDAMPVGGRLLLRSREAMNYRTGRRGLVITVADTGTGMPPEVQRRAFEAFLRPKALAGRGLGFGSAVRSLRGTMARCGFAAASRLPIMELCSSSFCPLSSELAWCEADGMSARLREQAANIL